MSDVSLFQSGKSIETFGSQDPTWMGPPGVDNIDVSMAPSKAAGRDDGSPKPPPRPTKTYAPSPGILPVVDTQTLGFNPPHPGYSPPVSPTNGKKPTEENGGITTQKTMIGNMETLPSAHFNDQRGTKNPPKPRPVPPPISTKKVEEKNDDDMPHKIDDIVPEPPAVRVKDLRDMLGAKRIEPDPEEKVKKPDATKLPRMNSSQNLVPSTKPSTPHKIPSETSLSQRYKQKQPLLNTFNKDGDVALVMPLHLQLSALEHAVNSAISACEELSEHRRREDWDVGPVSYLDKVPETRLVHLEERKFPRLENPFEVKTSYEKEYEKKEDEKEQVEEKDVLKRSQELLRDVMETWMERSKQLEMEDAKQQEVVEEEEKQQEEEEIKPTQYVPDPEAEREATRAAVEESTRWKALDDDLVTSIDAIRKEIGLLEEYQLQLNRAGPPLRSTIEEEEETKPPPIPPPSTTKKQNLHRKILMRSPISSGLPPPPPPASERKPHVEETKRSITFDSPKTSAEIEIYRKHVKEIGEIEDKIKHLESNLSVAVATESFDECITIQSQIDLLKTRRVRFEQNYENLRMSAQRLNSDMKNAVRGEDYSTARYLQNKLGNLVDAHNITPSDENNPISDKLKRLEAELAAALLAEDYFACAQIQQRIKPLREERLRASQKAEEARNKLERLEVELSEAIEMEDFERCEVIQRQIDSFSS